MKKSRTLAPSKYLRKYGKAKTTPVITKEEVEAVLECEITDERYEELLEASRTYSLSNSDKHVNLAQDAEHNRDWEGAKKHWKNAALASIKHDAHKGTNRSDKLKVRGITMRKEEVEQIDELSKPLLKRYVKKSLDDHSDGNFNLGRVKNKPDASDYGTKRHTIISDNLRGNMTTDELLHKVGQRAKGINNAVAKLSKEEVEQIDELSSETKKSYTKKAKADVELLSKAVKWHKDSSRPSQYKNKSADKFLIAKHTKKINKRNKGISQANEEVEQIDELSKKTLGSYVKKAEQSADYHTHHFSHYVKRTTPEGKYNKKAVEHHAKKFHKRTLGIKRATKKIEESHGISLATKQIAHEAVELSASRKTKVNALLAKHQAKGLPSKPSKKYTREYTGDGLPLIAAVINQEETLNELKKSTTTKHTCGGVSFGKKAPKGTCPRCDELHDGHAPVKWDHSKRDADIQRSKEIKAHDCKKSKCGPVCTFGDW